MNIPWEEKLILTEQLHFSIEFWRKSGVKQKTTLWVRQLPIKKLLPE